MTELHVTLWPDMPHFSAFSQKLDKINGIRLNTAMFGTSDLPTIRDIKSKVPLWWDFKGKQLRVEEAYEEPTGMVLRINHPIRVDLPQTVLFKAGKDFALLESIDITGKVLKFAGGSTVKILPGESLHIRHPSLRVLEIMSNKEKEKVALVKSLGYKKFYLSYVESQFEIDSFLELVGKDSELFVKIETPRGAEFAVNHFKKTPGVSLVAARGDLFVEAPRPHKIIEYTQAIIDADPEAVVGSRILVSTMLSPVPDCPDFSDLALLKYMGYKRFLLCDGICLKPEHLTPAVNVFHAFMNS